MTRQDIVERLRSNQPLPICPYDQKSPEYWTTPDDAPCKFCGGLPEGPDKCTGADTRIMGEAADEIEILRISLRANETEALGYLRAVGELQGRIAGLEKALERQGDNMAFVINHVTIPNQWMEKFMRELDEDRTALDAIKEG